MLKKLGAAFCCAMLFAIFPAIAGQWDKRTTVTFSAPVELPGIVLPAGTYIFRLADLAADRHVVQVFNAEETHVFATILAIPNYRLTPTSETTIRFEERRKDMPEAVRAWFYPADNFGQEFVYPKQRASELAVNAQVPVLAAEVVPAEKPEELINEPVVTITPENKEVEMVQVQPEATQPIIAEAEPLPAPAPVAELPKTASPLPLFILMGLCSLILAAVVRAVSKSTV